MTWHDVDLKKEGVQQLDELFSKPPYSFMKNSKVTHTEAHVHTAGKRIAFLSYDEGKIVIYRGVIDRFSQEVQDDIYEQLSKIGAIKKLLHELNS